MSKKVMKIALPVMAVALLIEFWWIAAIYNPVLAGPIDTINRFIELTERPLMGTSLGLHILASLRRILKAFIYASVIGITLGVCFGIFPTFRRVVYPIFAILRPIPPLAWIPIVVLWTGLSGDTSKVIIIFIGIVMAIVINTNVATSTTDELLIKAAHTLGANKRQIFFDVTLPNAIPTILAGMKTGLSTGWMSLVAAEMIASREGIGFMINQSMMMSDIALDFVGIILVALSSSILTIVLTMIERRLCPWLSLN